MSAPEFNTIASRFARAAESFSTLPALTAKLPGSKDWETMTYGDVAERVRYFSIGLRGLGIQPGERVAILSENRPEWAIADQAVLAAGGVTVPIYPTLPSAQVAHILADSGARVVVVSDSKQLQKGQQARETCPNVTAVVSMDQATAKGDVLSFEAVVQQGRAAPAEIASTYESVRDAVKPEDLMSLIYTSGTTGNPKGAMITHANMIAAIDGASKAFPFDATNEVFLSFLPLCHVFERVTYNLSLTMGSHTYYNDSIFRLLDNMLFARPTIMQCVPRVFETIHERTTDAVAKEPERKQKVFAWAVGVGEAYSARRNAGKHVSLVMTAQQAIADKLVLSKVRARFGGRLRFFVSGGAPLSNRTAGFFNAIGIPILQGWGLTETTAASTINPHGRNRVGTVGTAGFGADVSTAPDGELIVRGPHVMRGYWNLPEATADVIDKDGWFHTGDIGEIDADGYVKITDRKKDILVLTNGKKVAPQPIEKRLAESPLIDEVVLLGDSADSVAALIVPNFLRLAAALPQEEGRRSAADIAKDPAARKLIKAEVDKLSKDLADFEKIKKLALLDRKLSVEEGELTPTLKVRRKVVAERFGSLLERE